MSDGTSRIHREVVRRGNTLNPIEGIHVTRTTHFQCHALPVCVTQLSIWGTGILPSHEVTRIT